MPYTPIHTHTCIYRDIQMEHYSTMKNEIMPFATTWMDMQDIMLPEISQIDRDKNCVVSLICEMEKIQRASVYNKKETNSQMQGTN